MSKFTKQIKRTYQFEGDEITIIMGRLKRKDAIKLAPYMTEPDKDGIVKMRFEDSMMFADVSCDILKKYISSMSGMVDADGHTQSIDDIFGEEGGTYYMNLVAEVMGDLLDASFSSSDVEKKSVKQSDDTLEGSAEVVTLPSTSEESPSTFG